MIDRKEFIRYGVNNKKYNELKTYFSNIKNNRRIKFIKRML